MILFVSYGGGHITMIQRIFSYFISRGVECELLPLTTAVSYCKNHEISEYLKIEDYFDFQGMSLEWRTVIQRIAEENHNDEVGIPFEHTLAYYGIGLSGLFEEYGLNEGLNMFILNGRKSFKYEGFCKEFLRRVKPEAVFITNVPRMEKSFSKAAKALGIYSFAIDDLFGVPHEPIEADLVFVDNDTAKRNLLAINKDLNVEITGNPVFEELLSNNIQVVQNGTCLVVLQTGIRDLTKNVVYEFDDVFFENFFKNVISKLHTFSRIIVRFHPSMVKKSYWPDDSKIEVDENILISDSIRDTEFVFGMTSTGIYEAYLAGCKTFTLDFGEDYFKLPIESSGKIDLSGNFNVDLSGYALNSVLTRSNSNELIYNFVRNALSNNRK